MTDSGTHFIATTDHLNMDEFRFVATDDSCVIENRLVTKCADTGTVTRSQWNPMTTFYVDESETGHDVAIIAAAHMIDELVRQEKTIIHL